MRSLARAGWTFDPMILVGTRVGVGTAWGRSVMGKSACYASGLSEELEVVDLQVAYVGGAFGEVA